ncbi:MAG: hypothetical protein ACYSSI_10040 [Planctomycetota bacterium]
MPYQKIISDPIFKNSLPAGRQGYSANFKMKRNRKPRYLLLLVFILIVNFTTNAASLTIVGGVSGDKPQRGKLANRVEQITTIRLSGGEIKIFDEAFRAVEIVYIKDGRNNNAPKINLVYTSYGEVIIESKALGDDVDLAIYPIQQWRDMQANRLVRQVCFIEELVHHFWNMEDGVPELYQKVTEIMKIIKPSLELDDIYIKIKKDSEMRQLNIKHLQGLEPGFIF